MRTALAFVLAFPPSIPTLAPDDGSGPAPPHVAPEPLAPELLELFAYDASADLAVEEAGAVSFGDHERVDLSFASPRGGRVPAYLYVPAREGPWAAIVLMHGMPGDRSSGQTLARGYVRSGALVLALSAPWARTEPVEPITFTERDRANQVQLVVDLRRGVDLLLSFPEVDPDRIAYVGGSYGGAMGGLLAGVESRIRAYALLVGDGGLVAHSTGADDPVPPPGLGPDAWRAWLAAMEPIEPLRFVGHAAPAHLLFQNGREDELVPAADAAAYQAAGSEPKTVLWYDGGHALTPERVRDQARWLAERIGIDPSPLERGP